MKCRCSTRACPQTQWRRMLPGMESSDLTDAQWERLGPLLPPQRPRTGRPAKDHRTILNGILWILRTGSPWRALPERYGSWKTVSSRFYRWEQACIWERILAALQRQADIEGRLDWSLHFVDSTVVRAHQHAAGAKGGIRQRKRLVGVAAGSRPRFICGASAAANRWSSC
jgi:transposase